jgi:16S rRNA (adenine1518-N6/adenine1519-N6)-dimethyltransferase
MLSRPSSPAALLRQLGLRPRRGLSQSFLTDVGVTRQIASAAGLTVEDDVLEVGPGLGILTQELARRARRVVAFELDRELAAVLPSLLPENVQVVQGDALKLDPAEYLPGPYKLAANLPYQITSPFLFRYLSINPAPSVLVLMVQREVADRITATAGDLSYLAVAVQSAAKLRIVRQVPAGAFHPRPRVESAVIKLAPLADPLVPPERRDDFLELVRAGFGQPRKQLLNSLEHGFSQARLLGWPRAEVRDLLERADIASERRPQELRLDEWRTLFEAYLAVRTERDD